MNPLNHVAIIMDGNGRWGLKHTNSRNKGHKAGLKTVEKVIKETINQKIKYLTLFASMIADNFISTKIDAVISPAIGGIVLGTEVGRLLNARTIFAERKNGVMCIRRGFNIKKNQNILVVEDVITTGGSVKEVMSEVIKLGGLISGVAILVDRSNGTINLHKNQYSIVKLEAVSYDADRMPNNLKEIPVQKPGSRKTL